MYCPHSSIGRAGGFGPPGCRFESCWGLFQYPMKLIIVESPKKAKTIKKFLKNRDYFILASKGHIVDLPKKKFGVYLEGNKLKLEYYPIRKSFLNYLKKIKNRIEEFILATDPDREGEFIAWSVVEFLKIKNYSRVRFYEITKSSVLNSLANKEKINLNLVSAQKARRALDRIIGYTLSPILWRKGIGESAGRVQSSALRLIVEKEEEIKNFVPEVFYKLEVDFGDFKAYLVENSKGKFGKERLEFLKNIQNRVENSEFILEKIVKKKKIISKPLPLDTALLQRISFLKYKVSAPLTMKIAQSLYEKGLITYHRTDSFNLSKEFLGKVRNFLKDYFDFPKKIKKKFSQEAHEAIRPVYLKKELKLKGLEDKIYKLIFDYTLSACSKDAVIEETKYFLRPFSAKEISFLAYGERLIFDGFLKFYPFKIKFNELPELREGSLLKPKDVKIIEEKTKPPARYTESTLIKKLKSLGIGRPSTYAEIIKTLLKRNYVSKEKGFLKPTPKGINVVNFLKENFKDLIDLKFTANMEKDLDIIAKGEKDYEKYVIDFWKFLKNLL